MSHYTYEQEGKPLDLSADYVVVGSGAGGGAVAAALARGGAHVAVVEAGAWREPEDYPCSAYAMMRDHMDWAMLFTRGRANWPLVQGRAVGGSTTINSAIVVRTPGDVFQDWERDFGAAVGAEVDQLKAAEEKGEEVAWSRLPLIGPFYEEKAAAWFSSLLAPGKSPALEEECKTWIEKARRKVEDMMTTGGDIDPLTITRLCFGREVDLDLRSHLDQLSDEQLAQAEKVPIRKVFGNLTLRDLPPEAREECRWSAAYNTVSNAPLFWIDGKRTILQVWEKLIVQYPPYQFQMLLDYLTFLEKWGYIEWLQRKQ